MKDKNKITALVMDRNQNLRAAYVLPDEDTGRMSEVKLHVLAWAAVGGQVLPLRLDKKAGRLVAVGTPDDPDADRYFGLLMAGESMAALGEEVDRKVMDMLREGMHDGEANED